MVAAYIGLGANLGDPAGQIAEAIEALGLTGHTRLLRASSLYRSSPIGLLPQPDYVNAVVLVETDLTPHELLQAMLAIEQQLGRTRSTLNAPRTIDLDLLLYGTGSHESPGLSVPHPRMQDRAFVLAPLAELDPDIEIPGHGRAATLLERCSDQRIVKLPPE